MEFAYTLNGNAPHVKKYVIGASVANAGIPLLIAPTSEPGLANATTTSAADMVGVALDTGTYTTSQSGSTDVAVEVSVIINPDAVWLCKMSQGATENTALDLHTVDTASSGGTSVETDASFASAEMADGVVWGLTGLNAGRARRIDSTAGNHATVTVPFAAISVGDTFTKAPYWPLSNVDNVQLTTNLYQADADIAVGTGAAFQVIDLRLRDAADNGRTNSFVLIVSADHIFGNRPT